MDIDIYSKGIVVCSVCVFSNLDRGKIEQLVNLENPTGIASHWTISKENFRTGEKNPHPCESHQDRLHYLLNC